MNGKMCRLVRDAAHGFLSGTRAAVLLELTLMMPFLIIMMAAIAQFGVIFYVEATMQSAARAAARELTLTKQSENPGFTPCKDISIFQPVRSAEQATCAYLENSNLYGPFDAYKVDSEIATIDSKTIMKVSVRVEITKILFINVFNYFKDGWYITAYAEMESEDVV